MTDHELKQLIHNSRFIKMLLLFIKINSRIWRCPIVKMGTTSSYLSVKELSQDGTNEATKTLNFNSC